MKPDGEPQELTPVSPAQLRRGLGAVFILAGLLYIGTMLFATLVAMGKLPAAHMTSADWGRLYRGNFMFMSVGGLGYLGLTWYRKGVFLVQPVIDFAVGALSYIAMFALSAVLLERGLVPGWMSVIPGFVLLAYGESLRRGRQVWRGLDLA